MRGRYKDQDELAQAGLPGSVGTTEDVAGADSAEMVARKKEEAAFQPSPIPPIFGGGGLYITSPTSRPSTRENGGGSASGGSLEGTARGALASFTASPVLPRPVSRAFTFGVSTPAGSAAGTPLGGGGTRPGSSGGGRNVGNVDMCGAGGGTNSGREPVFNPVPTPGGDGDVRHALFLRHVLDRAPKRATPVAKP
jgi:hypothetical protein